MEDVMNMDQLAAYLGMSKSQLYHLVSTGRVPGVKAGKQWRFSRAAVDKWLDGNGKRSIGVLVVEDDEVIRNLITGLVQGAGHNCIGTHSARTSQTLLQEIQFDIVFLDLLLTDGTGLDVVEAAVKTERVPQFAVTTGHPEHELLDAIRQLLPCVTVLGKPVKLQTILDLVSHAAPTAPLSGSHDSVRGEARAWT